MTDLSLETRRAVRAEVEQEIRAGAHQMWIGFKRVRDEELWKGDYLSFKDYCQQVWGFGKQYGYRLASAGDVVVGLLESGVTTLPANERQAQELKGMSAEEAKLVLEVVKQSSPDGKITAAHIKTVSGYLKEMVTTGTATNGDGDQIVVSEVVKSGITAESHERMLRQIEHLKEHQQKSDLVFLKQLDYSRGGVGLFQILQAITSLDGRHTYVLKLFRKGDKDDRNSR